MTNHSEATSVWPAQGRMTMSQRTQDGTVNAVVSLAVDHLQPNEYNPNVMTPAEFAELVAEVRHLGRLPKPVVAGRPPPPPGRLSMASMARRAAREAGLAMVACEVVNADDFEAMRQTYKRNQHGTHNPVRLGQMFRRMMADRELSQRGLAAEIGVSEGTIRNSVVYAQAADLRNGYAGGPRGVPAIDSLSVRQVRAYVQLPPAIGNLWINCGAGLAALIGVKSEEEVSEAERAGVTVQDCANAYTTLEETGLVSYLPSDRYANFADLMKTLRGWADWEGRYCRMGLSRAMLRPYTEHYFREVWTVRDALMMDRVRSLVLDPTTRPPMFHLAPEEFAAALRPPETTEAQTVGDSADAGFARVEVAVLAKTGRLPQTRYCVDQELLRAEIETTAPDYIRLSALSLNVKAALWHASGWHQIDQARDPTISLDAAKRELAQLTQLVAHRGEKPEAAVQRHLMAYWEREHVQRQYDQLTESEMASTIARRLPLYDEETDRQAIAAVASTLMHLTKPELLALYAYTERTETWRALQEILSGLRLS